MLHLLIGVEDWLPAMPIAMDIKLVTSCPGSAKTSKFQQVADMTKKMCSKDGLR
jgi:hypothetical protein